MPILRFKSSKQRISRYVFNCLCLAIWQKTAYNSKVHLIYHILQDGSLPTRTGPKRPVADSPTSGIPPKRARISDFIDKEKNELFNLSEDDEQLRTDKVPSNGKSLKRVSCNPDPTSSDSDIELVPLASRIPKSK